MSLLRIWNMWEDEVLTGREMGWYVCGYAHGRLCVGVGACVCVCVCVIMNTLTILRRSKQFSSHVHRGN